MGKKRKTLVCMAFSMVVSANVNFVEAGAAAAPTPMPEGTAPVKDKVPAGKTEAYNQFRQLAGQGKYDEALAILHDVYKLDSLSSVKVAMMLDNRDQARQIIDKLLVKYPPTGQADRAGLHEYAVQLGRNKYYGESVAILQGVYAANPNDSVVAGDYAVVLSWAGNHRAAVDVYEKRTTKNSPVYVLNSVGGSYYRLGQFQKAQQTYHEAVLAGDSQAKLWEAESYVRLGNFDAASKIHEDILAKDPKNIAVLRGKASMLMLSRKYRDAITVLDQASAVAANSPNAAELKKAIRYDVAIAYIRMGDESKAIEILKPYVEGSKTDVFMQADYVAVLRTYQDYPAAISIAKKLWPNYDNVPLFGLQAYADSYVRIGQVEKAIPIYEYILKRDPNANAAKAGLAFARLKAGKIAQGIQAYDELIAKDPTVADIAIDDAAYFYEHGFCEAGQQLFELVVRRYPHSVSYRQQYADALYNNEMPRSAYKQYEKLSKLQGGKVVGLTGMASSAVQVGDYSTAKASVSVLQEKYASNALALQGIKDWEGRQLGEVNVEGKYYRDYKGIETRSLELEAEQSLGGSYSVLSKIGREEITDRSENPKQSTVLNSRSVGIQYKGMKSEVQAWYDYYLNDGSFSGYTANYKYHFDDRVTMGVEASRSPLKDVQALRPSLLGITGGRIMTDNYAFTTSILASKKDKFDVGITRSFYSDENQVNNYSLSWTRNLLKKDKRTIDFVVEGSQLHFSQRSDLYESPTIRDTYGAGLIEKWDYAKHYWEGRVIAEWGRDRPEATDFSPYARLEYGYKFSPVKSITAAVEYGARTNRAKNSSDMHFGHRMYEVLGHLSW
ncbi:MAG: Tetratricopeptide repeat-containing protein [Firmicutes bacterium]|nr:Tetratricopeptide repeat-containing protein [Bacillota bacterium]